LPTTKEQPDDLGFSRLGGSGGNACAESSGDDVMRCAERSLSPMRKRAPVAPMAGSGGLEIAS